MIRLLLMLLLTLSITPALSFVRSSPSGFSVSWNSNCLRMSLSESGSQDIEMSDLEAAISDSMQPWNDLDCSGVGLIYEGTTSSNVVGFSNTGPNGNLIVFQDDLGEWLYQPDILALTTLTFCSAEGGLCKFRGQILDGDIEFNGREEPFSANEQSLADHHDFVNTLTHELGHFIGLDHSLEPESTMYFSAPIEEIEKRTLDIDDQAGFCEIYETCEASDACSACWSSGSEINERPVESELAQGCDCEQSHSRDRPNPMLIFAILLYFARSRRSFR
jgi:hypothetical protein